jgi:MFS family permease
LQVCLITGSLVGSVAAGRFGRRTRFIALAISLWIFAVGVFAVGVSTGLLVAGLAVAVSGIGNAIFSVMNSSALMEAAASTNRGTVMSARYTVGQGTSAVGLVAGAAITGWLGPLRAFSTFGLGLLLLAGACTAFVVVQARATRHRGGRDRGQPLP